MKIAIESPQKLTDRDLEMIIGIWTRKARRRIVVKNVTLLYTVNIYYT